MESQRHCEEPSSGEQRDSSQICRGLPGYNLHASCPQLQRKQNPRLYKVLGKALAKNSELTVIIFVATGVSLQRSAPFPS
jgi:hypothetical protein